tara:strand:- start:131 stop:640 length:510 start_codon:yes stop_codon:yes gene_type:complete
LENQEVLRRLIKLFLIFIVLISCKEIVNEVETTDSLSSKSIDYSELNIESVYKINFYSKIDEWTNYLELSDYINQLNSNDYSTLIDNKKYLVRFFNGIKNTIPKDINKPEIKSRITVIETDFLKLESMLSHFEIDNETRIKIVKKINNSFSNLNFQIDKLLEKQEIIPE